MKKYILLGTILATSLSFGQNTFSANDNVGIGTINPVTKLEVVGVGLFRVPDDQSQVGGLVIGTNNGTNLKLGGNSTYSWIQSHNSMPLYINELGNNTILNLTGGYVGVGTTTPQAKLEVNGNVKVKENLLISGTSGGYTTGDNPALYFGLNDVFANIKIPFGDKMAFSSYHGYTFNTSNNGSTTVPALTIGITGKVGIGTTTPDQKLTVNGIIHAKEIIVDTNFTPDYVFQKYYTGKSTLKSDYVMPTLAEIESFTKKNNHLPNVPSAKEVQQNGVSLGEMSNVLLQKVEELTLYAIEQQKKQEEQNKTIAILVARLTSLEKK
jgi:hypothetical protein